MLAKDSLSERKLFAYIYLVNWVSNAHLFQVEDCFLSSISVSGKGLRGNIVIRNFLTFTDISVCVSGEGLRGHSVLRNFLTSSASVSGEGLRNFLTFPDTSVSVSGEGLRGHLPDILRLCFRRRATWSPS